MMIKNPAVGHKREKPWVYFIPVAHAILNSPAANK